ncbi:hypothetical protein T439DRAFT_332981 [Meredithblackwellia eburnea MCA 4105]
MSSSSPAFDAHGSLTGTASSNLSDPPDPELQEPTRSIRGPQADSVVSKFEDGDTFYEMLSIHLDQSVNSMSISPASRDVALGARKVGATPPPLGLFIVDLQNPYDPPRFLPHHSAWEVADVQWNPFPQRSEWVVSTVRGLCSNQKAVVYNLTFSPSLTVSPIEHTLHAHTRAITDVNWSPGAPEVLATCALDGWVWSWDLRTGYGSRSGAGGGRKPVWGVCSWGSGATQVKWNRRQPHIIASAHDKRVLIWDDRMGAEPVTTIEGHHSKISGPDPSVLLLPSQDGIDWSRLDPDMLVTCSLDKTFRSWDIKDTSSPDLTVMTSSPVWRARYTPFGRGVLTLPQRSDHALSIWGREKVEKSTTAQPVARFLGANTGVKEFVWRTRGGNDIEHDDRQFQLVTWANDRRLRLWPISDEILKEVGHKKGTPITIPFTRRHAPNISYRTFAESPAPPPAPLSFPTSPLPFSSKQPGSPVTSLLTASIQPTSPTGPSLLTSSLLTAGFAASTGPSNFVSAPPPTADRMRGAAVMTTTFVRNRRLRERERLAWMEGVKVLKTSDLEQTHGGKVLSSHESHAGETRSSSLVRGTDGGTAREGGETEKAESVLSPGSKATATPIGREQVHANLGEEFTSIVRRFPRVNFEKVHVAGRTCIVSLYSPMFIRATFTFPKNYPHSATPTIEIEKNADIPLKSRAFLLQSIRKLMAVRSQRGVPSFEQALRFLLGDRTDFDSKPQSMNDDDDDDDDGEDEEEGLEGLTVGTGVLGATILRNNLNVPPPRKGGAIFGPSGQLVVFFPTNVFSTPNTERAHTPQVEPISRRKLPPRLSEAFGNLTADRDAFEEDGYQETDEALQMSTGVSFQSSHILRPQSIAPVASQAPTFSSIVHIKDASHLTLLKPDRSPSSLSGSPIEVAKSALMSAISARDLLLASIWTTLVAFFDPEDGVAGPTALEKGVAETLLPELMTFLVHARDIQTLGVIACLLESHRRSLYELEELKQQPPPSTPSVDYFSHRAPAPSEGTTPYDVRTPMASGYRQPRDSGHSLASHSPKASWTNLAGLFNSSVLSLRSGGSPTAGSGSPDLPRSLDHSPDAPQSGSPGRLNPSPPENRTHAHLKRPALTRQPSKLREHISNVTFGPTSVAVINVNPTISRPPQLVETNPTHWWATDRAQIELEFLRLAYAELLSRWRLDTARLDVLKLCRATKSSIFGAQGASLVRTGNGLGPSVSIDIGRNILRRDPSSLTPNDTELSMSCNTCLHLGHLECLQKWYSENDSCPTGCGCACVSSGGTSGLFYTSPPAPKSVVEKSTKYWLQSSLPFLGA